jgi:Polyketide cyclase / dehydrase and lipid transport
MRRRTATVVFVVTAAVLALFGVFLARESGSYSDKKIRPAVQLSVDQIKRLDGVVVDRAYVSAEIAAPAPAVWARVSDHEATPTWVEVVKKVTLTRDGEPRGGLGAIRVVQFKPLLWSTVTEEVVYFDPPHQFHYVVRKGTPGLRDHLGKVIVEDLGGGRSRLRWEVDFMFAQFHPLHFMVPRIMHDFGAAIADGVEALKQQMEGAPGAPGAAGATGAIRRAS